MRRLGRGKRNHRIGGKTGPSTVAAVSSAAHPEGRSTASTGAVLAFIHSSAASASPFSGGLNPVPTTASTIRSVSSAPVVPRQFLGRRRSRESARARYSSVRATPRPHRPSVPSGSPSSSVVTSSPARQAAAPPSCRRRRCCPRPHSTVTRRACGNCVPRKPRHSRRRGAHQVNRRHPEPLRRRAVAGLHLGCGKNYASPIHNSRCQNSTRA